MNWDDYDLDGVEKALEDGHMITTGIASPTGLTANILDTKDKSRIEGGASLVGREGVTPESEGPASILKALEIAGKEYLDQEPPADEVENGDAISDFLLKQQISYLNMRFDEGYVITDESGLTGEGETFEEAYEELQNELWSKLDI